MKLFYLFLFISISTFVRSQEVIPLYEKNEVPNWKSSELEEKVWNFPSKNGISRFVSLVSNPEITVYLPTKEKNKGIAVIICPGGGYTGLAIDHEGHHIAKKLNEFGIAGIVLKYRLPFTDVVNNKDIVPLQDAQRAIQIVRENSSKWNIHPNKIGIEGNSAGGHLASTAGTHFTKELIANPKSLSLRPNFMILNYPVISFADSLTHFGSRFNLIGSMPSEDLKKNPDGSTKFRK